MRDQLIDLLRRAWIRLRSRRARPDHARVRDRGRDHPRRPRGGHPGLEQGARQPRSATSSSSSWAADDRRACGSARGSTPVARSAAWRRSRLSWSCRWCSCQCCSAWSIFGQIEHTRLVVDAAAAAGARQAAVVGEDSAAVRERIATELRDGGIDPGPGDGSPSSRRSPTGASRSGSPCRSTPRRRSRSSAPGRSR